MEFINFLMNPKINQPCLLCFAQVNNCPTNIYSNFEIENKYFSANLNLKDMITYLFPEYDISLSQACESCTDLLIKMYIKLRNNKIIKTVILNLINDLNLELDKDGNILSRPCYLNINKSKLAIEKEWSPIYPNTVSSSENKIKGINIQKQCEECYKTFSSIKTYKLHIKTHKRRRQKTYYSCVHCDYKTLNKSSLQGHINKSHIKVRQFVCQVCFKSFYHKKNLTEHVRSHTKARDEVCEICGETFLHRKNLLEHLRLHNNVRPYECNICSKRFITSGRRSDHIKRTHREKNEVCLLCDKRFSLPKELTRHIKSVHS